VFALDINPKKLASIRTNRMKTLRMGSSSQYAQLSKVKEEIHWVHQLYARNPKWTVIETTDAGIEESCARILMAIDEIGGLRSRMDNVENPSAI